MVLIDLYRKFNHNRSLIYNIIGTFAVKGGTMLLSLISMPLSALDIMNLETGSRAAGSSAELPVRMVQSDENGVTVTYQFSFAELSGDPLYPECTLFRIPGFSLVDEPGKPSVPIRTDIIGIPSNKTAKITITDTRYREYPIKVAPARPVLSDDNYETYTLNNVPPVNYYSGYFGTLPNFRG